MTSDDFRTLIAGNDDAVLLNTTLHSDAAPYAFDPEPAKWNAFRASLATKLGLNSTDIRIVGSGRLGFSLKPGAQLRAFSDRSDIDVVVVNADAFDTIWHKLLEAAYPRPPIVFGKSLTAARNAVYMGWLTPMKIGFDQNLWLTQARMKPVMEERTKWFNTLQDASQFPPRRHEAIQCRLYRSWQHAEAYTLYSISELKKTL